MLRKTALFIGTTVLFAVAFLTFLDVQGESDLTIHITYAEQITSVRDGGAPHFLFALLLKTLARAGVSYSAGAVLVLALCYGGMAVLIAREMERRGIVLTTVRAFIVVPGVLIASHIFLFTLPWRNMYYGYFVPIVYHNPTQQLGKLFGLWIYFVYAREFLDRRAPRVGSVALIGVLCAVSAFAKPSFLLAFVPAAGCFAAADVLKGRWRAPLLAAAGIALPSAAVLLWQASFTYGGSAGPGIAFSPFVTFDLAETLYKLPLSLAFPLLVWTAARREHALDRKLLFVVVFTAIALVITLCFVESGREMAGNFAWTGQTAVFLAYVECVLFLSDRLNDPRWKPAAWALFSVHVLCGAVWYATAFVPSRSSFL